MAAARKIASMPARCPRCGWKTCSRPPRKPSRVTGKETSGQDVSGCTIGYARGVQHLPRLVDARALDHDAAWQDAEAALDHAHVGVEHRVADAGVPEQA